MGRKIPGKKCKRIKDPEKQRAARLETLKDKINLPPAHPDVQEIPHSLQKIIKLKEQAKDRHINRVDKRRKKNTLISGEILVGNEVDLPGMTKPVRSVPNFDQRKGETEDRYINRVARLCHNVVSEAKFEKKFNVEVHRNPISGSVEQVLKCTDEDFSKKKKISKKPKELKNIKRGKYKKAVKKLAKLKRQEKEFEHLTDEIKFGEVVHQPPTLKVLPRKAPINSEGRPGKKDLILKKLLIPSVASSNASKQGKYKWKNIPEGDRMRMEQRREDAIKAYKMLKAQKSAQRKTM